MSNVFGEILRVATFGESHGPAIGAVLDGVPPGLHLDLRFVQRELDRRRPGTSDLVSARRERDRVRVLSGVFEGVTTGAPICLVIGSRDARPVDYEPLRDRFRPGHGDWTWWAKYGVRDWRGGGRLSGRETAARVAAGAIAKLLLGPLGVDVAAQVIEIAGIAAVRRDAAVAARSPLCCGDLRAAARMATAIRRAKAAGDSVGGIVEVVATGVPPGWGDPVFGKLDARLGGALLSIGAVKAVEFGDGFALARMRGSEANDPLTPRGPASNHAGGILGGISDGAPIVARVAIKPTSTIDIEQDTIDVGGRPARIRARGRHDPCIAPRIVPVAEAMVALVLADAALRQEALRAFSPPVP
ncbi:MAG: chorismate synthase [Deltaproteobacteria bacterium]|nr:chorismate synthase [Deltaproteobacteria bacterium]